MTRRHRVEVVALFRALDRLGLEPRWDGDRVVVADAAMPLRATADLEDLDDTTVFVAPEVPATAREEIRAGNGAGWLDARNLHLRVPGLVIVGGRTDEPAAADVGPDRAVRVLAGPAVSAAAMNALMSWPEPMLGVRALSRLADVTAGGITRAAGRLVDAGLLTDNRRATRNLFWETAREWRPSWHEVGELGGIDVSARAASELGAPIPAGPGSRREVLVASEAELALAEMSSLSRVENIRAAVAPSPIAVDAAETSDDAKRVLVALVLATDPGRGTEIVESWTGDHVWR